MWKHFELRKWMGEMKDFLEKCRVGNFETSTTQEKGISVQRHREKSFEIGEEGRKKRKSYLSECPVFVGHNQCRPCHALFCSTMPTEGQTSTRRRCFPAGVQNTAARHENTWGVEGNIWRSKCPVCPCVLVDWASASRCARTTHWTPCFRNLAKDSEDARRDPVMPVPVFMKVWKFEISS